MNLLVVGGLHGADVLPDDPALGLTSWFSAGANVPNTWVTDFAYVPGVDDLVLGTMGEGAWLLTDASQQLLDAMAGQASTQLAAPTATQAVRHAHPLGRRAGPDRGLADADRLGGLLRRRDGHARPARLGRAQRLGRGRRAGPAGPARGLDRARGRVFGRFELRLVARRRRR